MTISSKDLQTLKDAHEQLLHMTGYARHVRHSIMSMLSTFNGSNQARQSGLKMLDIDLIDDAWLAALQLKKVINATQKKGTTPCLKKSQSRLAKSRMSK